MQIKLADFGLAREEAMGGMTCEAGTYRWMAPEVLFLYCLKNILQLHICLLCLTLSFSELVIQQRSTSSRSKETL